MLVEREIGIAFLAHLMNQFCRIRQALCTDARRDCLPMLTNLLQRSKLALLPQCMVLFTLIQLHLYGFLQMQMPESFDDPGISVILFVYLRARTYATTASPNPAATRNASARSVFSQGNSTSSRPK